MKPTPIAVAGATLAGILLRVPGLGRQGLWTDEAGTAFWATLPFRDLLSQARADCQAPLYYVLQSLVSAGRGASETQVRSLACLAGIVSIPLIYLLGKRLISVQAGVWAAWLLALSPMHVHYSREARNYTWLALMVVLVLLAAEALHRRPGPGTILAAGAALLGLAYVHNLGVVYAAGVLAGPVWEALGARDRPRLRAWAWVAGIFLAGFLPWALVILDQSSKMDVVYAWMKPHWEANFPWQPILSLAALSPGSMTPVRNGIDRLIPAAWAGLALAALLAGRALVSRAGWRRPRSSVWLLLAILLPLGMIFGYSCLRAPIHVVGRVDSPLLPFLLLLMAAGLSSVPRPWAAAAAGSVVLLVAFPLTVELGTDFRSQERSIAQYLSRRMAPADSLIVTGVYKPSFYYYLGASRPDVQIRVFPPERDLHPSWIDWSRYTEGTLASAANDLVDTAAQGGGRVWAVLAEDKAKDPLAAALSLRFGSPERVRTNYLGLEIQGYPAAGVSPSSGGQPSARAPGP